MPSHGRGSINIGCLAGFWSEKKPRKTPRRWGKEQTPVGQASSRCHGCAFWPRAVLLQLEPAIESPGEVVKMQIAGCQPWSLSFSRPALDMSISNRFPEDGEAPGPGTSF